VGRVKARSETIRVPALIFTRVKIGVAARWTPPCPSVRGRQQHIAMRKVRLRALLPCGGAAFGWVIFLVAVEPLTKADQAYAGVMAGIACTILVLLLQTSTRQDAEPGAVAFAQLVKGLAASLTLLSVLSGLIAVLPEVQHHPQVLNKLATVATAGLGTLIGLGVGLGLCAAGDAWFASHPYTRERTREIRMREKHAAAMHAEDLDELA
jgi:Zn-dependent protease with chaperone function